MTPLFAAPTLLSATAAPRNMLAAFGALLLLNAAPARADELQARLLASAKAIGPADFAFTRTTRSEQRGGGEAKLRTTVDRYDPTRPPAQRWTLVSIDGRAPTADEADKAAKAYATAFVPSYGRLARWVGAKAIRSEADGRAVYRYAGLPKGTLDFNGKDLSADTNAEAFVAPGPAPFVERTRFVSNKPFRMMLVARVERFEASQRFRAGADGRPVPVEFVTEMVGSMMGKAGSVRTVTTFSDVRAVGAAGSPSR